MKQLTIEYVTRKTKNHRILTENDSGKANFDGKTIENRILTACMSQSTMNLFWSTMKKIKNYRILTDNVSRKPHFDENTI